MSIFGSLLDELIVNGVKGGAGGGIGSGLGGAAGAAIGGGVSGAFTPGVPPPRTLPATPPPRDLVTPPDPGQLDTTTDPKYDDPQLGNTIEGVDVTAPSSAPAPQALSSAGLADYSQASAFGGGVSGALSPPPVANIGPTDVAGVTVNAPGGRIEQGTPLTPVNLAGAISGVVPTPIPDGLKTLDVDPNSLNTDPDKKGIGPEALGLLGLLGLNPKNLLGLGLLGAGLAGALGGKGKGDPNAPGSPTAGLNDIATSNQALAKQLGASSQAAMNGNIGAKGLGAIGRMVRRAQAAIRSRYAEMGMSGSSGEQQDLQEAAMAGVDMQFKVGQQMAQTGLAAIAGLTGQSAAAYTALLNAQTAKDSQLGNALANFAGALVK